MYKLLKVLMLSAVMVSAVGAQTWKAGEKVTAALSGGTLTIKGTGSMFDYYDMDEAAPWGNSESVKNVVIVDGITSIGTDAFAGCLGLRTITIPNSVKSIGSGAFRYRVGLTSITIPNSVTSIGYGAFEGCTGLTSVIVLNPTPPAFEQDVFGEVNMAKVCLYVPSASIAAYRSANGWKAFSCIKDVESR